MAHRVSPLINIYLAFTVYRVPLHAGSRNKRDRHDCAYSAGEAVWKRMLAWGLPPQKEWGALGYSREGIANLHAESSWICTIPYTKCHLWETNLYCPDAQRYAE